MVLLTSLLQKKRHLLIQEDIKSLIHEVIIKISSNIIQLYILPLSSPPSHLSSLFFLHTCVTSPIIFSRPSRILVKRGPCTSFPNYFQMSFSPSLCLLKFDHPSPPLFPLSTTALPCRVQPNGANPSKEGFDDETNKATTREMPSSLSEACWPRLAAKRAFFCLHLTVRLESPSNMAAFQRRGI